MDYDHTIFASATGPGPAAVGIFRISGARAFSVFGHLVDGGIPPHRMFTVRDMIDPNDSRLVDQVGVLAFMSPSSFTGEDVVELHHHGSAAITRWLYRILANQPNFRVAEAGEFTKRALLNGKMDVNMAEAIIDAIDAENLGQLKTAAYGLCGEVSEQIANFQRQIVECLAIVEAEIDFAPEEEVEEGISHQLQDRLCELYRLLGNAVDGYRRWRENQRPYTVVLFGEPNVGKSSLINAIAQQDVSIVTSEPGTTRDIVKARLELEGRFVDIIDTAGLRVAESEAEAIGIQRGKAATSSADLRIRIVDAASSHPAHGGCHDMLVYTKSDLIVGSFDGCHDGIVTSALRGTGIDDLVRAISLKMRNDATEMTSEAVVNERQCFAIAEAHSAIGKMLQDGQFSLDLMAEELRIAARSLAASAGFVTDEAILDQIFSRFCIGK